MPRRPARATAARCCSSRTSSTATRRTPRTTRWRSREPSWRAPIHKGDRIRITGIYENKRAAWYTAMTHTGFYIDETQPPQGPLQALPRRQGREEEGAQEGQGHERVASARLIDPTEGVPNRAVGPPRTTSACGKKFGADPCEPPFKAAPSPAPRPARSTIANFQYLPGDRGAPRRPGPAADGQAGRDAHVRQRRPAGEHPPLGHDLQVPVQRPLRRRTTRTRTALGLRHARLRPDRRRHAEPGRQTPTDLPVGKYSYFCRIHPFMRGEFRVVP